MNNYKFSLGYIMLLLALSFFHHRLQSYIMHSSAGKFATYIIYGLFISFFLVVAVKAIVSGKNQEIAIALLAMGLIFFFLFSNPRFLFKLTVLEFFILGILVSLENRKNKSIIPFILILGTACLVELAANLPGGRTFLYLNAWVYSLNSLAGYICGFQVQS